jgi:hypothetical protein
MLYVGLSLTLNFSFLFLMMKIVLSICSICPCIMNHIYIACITKFMFTCKHMHSVFNNMTSAAIYFGVCELSYVFTYILSKPFYTRYPGI